VLEMALLGRQGAAFQGHLRDVTVRRPVTPVTVDENGVTVLMWAAIGGQLHVVQWLLREGGSDAAERDKHGMTALLLAALHQKWSCVQWLTSWLSRWATATRRARRRCSFRC
jgi:ankyrin repeat protein